MNSIKETLRSLWQKAASFLGGQAAKAKPIAARAMRFCARRRAAITAVCSVLILSMLMSVITVSIRKIEIYDNDTLAADFHAIFTDEETLLKKSGLTLGEADETILSEEGSRIVLKILRAFPVTIEADGKEHSLMMTGGTVADALKKAGLTAGTEDLLSAEPEAALESGMKIRLDRVTAEEITVTESIDFDTKRVETDQLYAGDTKIKQKGAEGKLKKTYRVTYVNGEESDRELIDSEVLQEPTDKIILVGTKAKKTFLSSSKAPKNYKKVVTMTATAYSAGGTTASGRPAKWGVVAVDPRVIPLGTKVYVETPDGSYIYGTAIAADTGGAIKGYKIDICVNTRAEAYRFGRRPVNVYIY